MQVLTGFLPSTESITSPSMRIGESASRPQRKICKELPVTVHAENTSSPEGWVKGAYLYDFVYTFYTFSDFH
jgi:hypothetical protein